MPVHLADALTAMQLPRNVTNATMYLEYVDVASSMPALARRLPIPRYLWGQPLRWVGVGRVVVPNELMLSRQQHGEAVGWPGQHHFLHPQRRSRECVAAAGGRERVYRFPALW